jgi:hypothetical protein
MSVFFVMLVLDSIVRSEEFSVIILLPTRAIAETVRSNIAIAKLPQSHACSRSFGITHD